MSDPAYESGMSSRYTCSECSYVLLDAAYGDVEDHWRADHTQTVAVDPALRPILDDLRALTEAAQEQRS